ncbi:MAG TPA: glycosyltransferase family 1 protein [Anaerolineae bacterium]|nr:glycosyltransferase family 1 protein [Anaerolineae bacterium]
MRICMFHRYYLPVFSGAAMFSHDEAQVMLEQGHKVWVLTPRYLGLPHEEVLDGVPVIRAPIAGRTRRQQFLTFMFSATRELVRRRDDYEILNLFDLDSFDLLPVLIAKALGKSVLYRITMMPANPSRVVEKRGVALTSLGLRLVDGFAVLSTAMVPFLEATGLSDRPIAFLPNHVDTALYRPASPSEKTELRRELGLEQDATYLCFVGSVVERKGVDVLLSAFGRVADQCAEARLLVVGPDVFIKPGFEDEPNQRCQDFADAMKRRVRELGLATRVIFTGRTDQVPEYLRASDMFVFPSRKEGMPRVVIEAMATGLPCIVAHLDGATEDMITHGVDGYIVEGHDPALYAEQVLHLLGNPAEAERMGQAARRTVEEKFRLEHVVERYISFCQELLAR